MKRLALLSTVLTVAALLAFATTAAQGDKLLKGGPPPTGVMYDMWECQPDGMLHVANAEGQFVEVFAATGEMVWCGHIPADYFVFPCPYMGEGPEGDVLHVWTGSGAYFCIDRDEDWIWE